MVNQWTSARQEGIACEAIYFWINFHSIYPQVRIIAILPVQKQNKKQRGSSLVVLNTAMERL